MKNNQLVTGESNAARSFQRALQLDPTNQQARDGEEAVVTRIDFVVRGLIVEGSLDRAEEVLRLARELYPSRVAFEALESSLAAKREE